MKGWVVGLVCGCGFGLVQLFLKIKDRQIPNYSQSCEICTDTDNSRSGFDTALRSRAATAVTYPKRSTGSTRQLTVKKESFYLENCMDRQPLPPLSASKNCSG
ncbi:hypothetical protein E2C01_006386 [Portunus trituberculatus]|uniref:Uncharacterized protein n=1 Tax=Portunus trituberculatus TaxID=210409 RepID=A0A5B7CZ74_PORTR|nr:hypothetical protein [Portunus trituberculatus]